MNGYFAPDALLGNAMTARMTFATNEGRGGELVWFR